MILLKNLITELKLYRWKGAQGGTKSGKVGRHFCSINARKKYWQLKDKGKNIKYVEGEVYVPLEYGEYKWIDHVWNLINGKVYDYTLGKNDYEYKGYIVKDEYMNKVPKSMLSYLDSDDYRDANIWVGYAFGKRKAYE